MNVKILKFAAIALLLAGTAVACGKNNDNDSKTIKVKGSLVGYHKCTNEKGECTFGVYIVTDGKDLLSYNMPHKILKTLLNVDNIEDLKSGSSYFNSEISPIVFDYRMSEERETVTVSCPQNTMDMMFDGRYFKQIIITEINGEKINLNKEPVEPTTLTEPEAPIKEDSVFTKTGRVVDVGRYYWSYAGCKGYEIDIDGGPNYKPDNLPDEYKGHRLEVKVTYRITKEKHACGVYEDSRDREIPIIHIIKIEKL